MSSADNKIEISNDDQPTDSNFHYILEKYPYSTIHYYAPGAVVHNYFGKKSMSNCDVSDRVEATPPTCRKK